MPLIESQHRGSAMERVRHPEITPLEFSDIQIEDGAGRERSQARQFCRSLRQALETLTAGRNTSAFEHPAAERLAGVEAVFLTGGRIEDAGVRERASRLFQPMIFGQEPLFGGAPGGWELLRARGLSGWVADLGKSQLKLAAPGRRWTFPRDSKRLHPPGEVSPAEEPAQNRRLREFIALGLQFAMAESGERPGALVFALPTSLAADGTPGTSNYAGMRGDRTLLPDALDMAGLAGLPLFVLNDAELAALSALTDARLAGFRKILVLTVGFGIGFALVCRLG
jgi:hypothetical protein